MCAAASSSWVASSRSGVSVLSSSVHHKQKKAGDSRHLITWKASPHHTSASSAFYSNNYAISVGLPFATPQIPHHTHHPAQLSASVPALSSLDKKKKGSESSSVFGQAIDPNGGENFFLIKITRYLQAKALNLENIFETPVPKAELKLLKQKSNAEKEGIQLTAYSKTPHTVAELLKVFLQKLPEPLLSFDAYDSFLLVLSLEEFQDRITALKHIIESLPHWHRVNANLVLSLLNRIDTNKDTNKMNAERLATVIGPLILRPTEDLRYCESDGPQVIELVKILIEDYPLLFSQPSTQKKALYGNAIKRKPCTTSRLRQFKFKAPPPPQRERDDATPTPPPQLDTQIPHLAPRIGSPREAALSPPTISSASVSSAPKTVKDAEQWAVEMMRLIRDTSDQAKFVSLSQTVRDAKRFFNSKIKIDLVHAFSQSNPRVKQPVQKFAENEGVKVALQNTLATALDEISDQIHYLNSQPPEEANELITEFFKMLESQSQTINHDSLKL